MLVLVLETARWGEPADGWENFLEQVDESWYLERQNNSCRECGKCFDYSGFPTCVCDVDLNDYITSPTVPIGEAERLQPANEPYNFAERLKSYTPIAKAIAKKPAKRRMLEAQQLAEDAAAAPAPRAMEAEDEWEAAKRFKGGGRGTSAASGAKGIAAAPTPQQRQQQQQQQHPAAASKSEGAKPAAAAMGLGEISQEAGLGVEEMFRQIMQGQKTFGGKVDLLTQDVKDFKEVVDARVAKTEEQVKTLDTKVDLALAEIKQLKEGDVLSMGSGGTNYSGGGRSTSYNPEWKPRFIEFKGWVSKAGWKDRELKQKESMKQELMNKVVDQLVKSPQLDALHRAQIDAKKTIGENTGRSWPYTRGRIYFKEGTESNTLHEIKHVWEQDFTDGKNDLPANTRFNVECAPWKQPHVRAIGRFQGIFSEFKQVQTSMVKGEAGPPESFMWYYQDPDDLENKTLIAEWTPSKTWNLYGANLTRVEPDIDQAKLLSTLRGSN